MGELLSMHPGSGSAYPWDLVELDYRAGFLPIAGICHKYGMSHERLTTTAKRCGWLRRELQAEDLYGDGATPTPPALSPLSESTLAERARTQAHSVLGSHRKMIATARIQAEELLSRLTCHLMGRDKTGINEEGEPFIMPFKAPRESPADVLDKLSKAMVRLVGLERQAFGLEVLLDPTDGEGEAESAIPKATLESVIKKMDAIASAKRDGRDMELGATLVDEAPVSELPTGIGPSTRP